MPKHESSELVRSRRAARDFTVPASAFAELPYNSLRLLAARMVDQPHFAWALSKNTSPHAAFESSWSPTSDSLFSRAVERGHLALARVLSRRRATLRSTGPDLFPDRFRLDVEFQPHALKALSAAGPSDERLWHARSWMQRDLGAKSEPNGIRARELAQEAQHALALGRPWLALRLCNVLAEMSPEALAGGTGGEPDLQPDISTWNLAAHDEMSFRQSWRASSANHESLSAHQSSSRTKNLFTSYSLLALLEFGQSQLLKAQGAGDLPPEFSELAGALGAMRQRLWHGGACTSPLDFSTLFKAHPFGPDDPRAQNLITDPHDLTQITSLWQDAACEPKAPCGTGILWDVFCNTFAGVEEVNPNPFAILPGPACAALWSLGKGGALVELGVERGFDPLPVDALLMTPGTSALAFKNPSSVLPELTRMRLDSGWGKVMAHTGVWPALGATGSLRSARSTMSKDKAKSVAVAKLVKAARMSEAGSTVKVDNETFLRSHITSLAVLCGCTSAAVALMRSGCTPPDIGLVNKELSIQGAWTDAEGRLTAYLDATVVKSVLPAFELLPTQRPFRI